VIEREDLEWAVAQLREELASWSPTAR
jgi:hypothetical protein